MRKSRISHYIHGTILLAEERRGAKNAPVVFQSSGYTIDTKAFEESWIKTQFRTIPKKNRSNVSDPFMFSMDNEAYEKVDCTVYTVYFLPTCSGIKEAANALYDVVKMWDFDNMLFIGHSKGALLMTEMLRYVQTKQANVLLISPTYPTMFGDEELLLKQMDEIGDIRRHLIKPIIKLIGSRRKVDYDMAPSSLFLKQLDISQLAKHNSKLIVANCTISTDIFDRMFKILGQIIGLEEADTERVGHDGMCLLKDQLRFAPYCKGKPHYLVGCHQNSFQRSSIWIRDELAEIAAKNVKA